MKSFLALLTLIAAHSASANSIAVQLVPCTNSESVCAKVLKDYTTGRDWQGREMDIVSDGATRAEIYGIFGQAKGALPTIGVEGNVFEVYSGFDFKLKVNRLARPAGGSYAWK